MAVSPSSENEVIPLNQETQISPVLANFPLDLKEKGVASVNLDGGTFHGAHFGPKTTNQTIQAPNIEHATIIENHYHYGEKPQEETDGDESTEASISRGKQSRKAKQIPDEKQILPEKESERPEILKKLKFLSMGLDNLQWHIICTYRSYDIIVAKNIESGCLVHTKPAKVSDKSDLSQFKCMINGQERTCNDLQAIKITLPCSPIWPGIVVWFDLESLTLFAYNLCEEMRRVKFKNQCDRESKMTILPSFEPCPIFPLEELVKSGMVQKKKKSEQKRKKKKKEQEEEKEEPLPGVEFAIIPKCPIFKIVPSRE